MHLENHLHQFVVFMKNQHQDLPDSLLLQFNFGDLIVGSEETVTEPNSEAEAKAEDQPAPTEAEGPQLEAHSSIENWEEGDSGDDKFEPSKITPPKRRRKHTIGDKYNDKPEEEPPVPSHKGKKKVKSEEDSEDVSAYIDAEI